MKTLVSLLLLLLLSVIRSSADEPKRVEVAPVTPTPSATPSNVSSAVATQERDGSRMFYVTISEYQVELGDEKGLPGKFYYGNSMTDSFANDLLRSLQQIKVDPTETVNTIAIENSPTKVSISKKVQRVTGTITRNDTQNPTRPPQVIQNRTELNIGTTLEVTLKSQGPKIHVDVAYESARFREPAEGELDSGIKTMNVHSKLLMELGKPILIGGTSGINSSYLFLTIEESK